MLRREAVIAKLRDIGYRFKKDAWRVSIFTRGTHRSMVPKKDLLEQETVCHLLRQAGQTPEQIRDFIAAARS